MVHGRIETACRPENKLRLDLPRRARLKRYGKNELAAEKPLPAWHKFFAQFADVLVVILLGAGVLSIGLWLYERDALPYISIASSMKG
jgi:magnesium-transporting ATPase (P-type)